MYYPPASEEELADLPFLTNGPSSTACLDAGLVCSIDPRTRRCTECGGAAHPLDTETLEARHKLITGGETAVYLPTGEEDYFPATEADAHREWHRNTGNPIGRTSCPWDACDPAAYYDALDEDTEGSTPDQATQQQPTPPPARPEPPADDPFARMDEPPF